MCRRWRKSFDAFVEDMGPRPGPEYSVDRIKNNKGYSKGNCRWATQLMQARNKSNNRLMRYKGKMRPLSEIAELAGVPYWSFWKRINEGKSISQAISEYEPWPTFTHNGKTQRMIEWANEYGISVDLLRSRVIQLKWPFEIALTRPASSAIPLTGPRGTLYEFRGETLNLPQWAKKLGMSLNTLYTRIRKNGMSIEEAFTTSTERGPRKVRHGSYTQFRLRECKCKVCTDAHEAYRIGRRVYNKMARLAKKAKK